MSMFFKKIIIQEEGMRNLKWNKEISKLIQNGYFKAKLTTTLIQATVLISIFSIINILL